MQQYADPIQVRLPEAVVQRLRRESTREGIPVSLLIRRCVLRDYGEDSYLPENSRNPDEDTGKLHSVNKEGIPADGSD